LRSGTEWHWKNILVCTAAFTAEGRGASEKIMDSTAPGARLASEPAEPAAAVENAPPDGVKAAAAAAAAADGVVGV
jgi:hypothetical protein